MFHTSTSWDNDKDHVHVLYISHTMVLLWVKDSTFLSPSTVQRLATHSYDVLMFCRMCTIHLPSSPFPYSDSNEMSGGSYRLSYLPQMDLYVYTDFPLIERFLARLRPEFENFTSSMDT
jgi:hypothetical protein